jgi:hypothetical protein
MEQSDNSIIQLSENISNHICHELANSIGALDGSIEFLEDETYRDEALQNIQKASHSSVSRLKYLRQMYGFGSHRLPLNYLTSLAKEMFRDSVAKLVFNYDETLQIALGSTASKLFLAFVYISHGDMPLGGTINVMITYDEKMHDCEIKISSISDKIKKDRKYIYEILAGVEPFDPISYRNVLAYYVRYLADNHNKKYTVEERDGSVNYLFKGTAYKI